MPGTRQDSRQAGTTAGAGALKTSHQVTILGQQYTLRSDATAEQVHEVVDFVRQSLEEVTGRHRAVDSLDAAVLALFNVAGSLLREKRALSSRDEDLERVIAKIDRALAEHGHGGGNSDQVLE